MTQEVKLRRVQCNYQAENARFLLECDFSKQYSHYYRKRLEKTRPFLEFNARCKWAATIPIYGLEELASFCSCDINDTELSNLSPTSVSSTTIRSGTLGIHQFPKRPRRSSESSLISNSDPKSSTQKDTGQDNCPTPSTSKHEVPIISPIILKKSNIEKFNEEASSESHSIPDCIIIGTIFKRMKLQPDVVEELSRGDFHVKCERYLGHYVSQDDKLVLEDQNESISLVGNIDPKRFVTGIVVALLGIPIDDGSRFLVKDICYAEPNRLLLYEDELLNSSQTQAEKSLNCPQNEPIYLMVVSGLGFHQDMSKRPSYIGALQNVIDFVWGGSKYSEDERCSRVARILVIGDNLLESRFLSEDDEKSSQGQDLARKLKQARQVKQFTGSIQAVKNMDDFFAQLSKTINVDVMPGPSDPSSHLMPQQPFHPCMLPKSCMFSTFNCTTNPHHAIYNDNVEILATSGQNIDIISKFSAISGPLEIMKCHLMWGNSAPSAPDNLYSVPYENEDPYVIDFIPEIYLAGCQDSFRSEYFYYTSSESPSSSQSSGRLNLSQFNEPSSSQEDFLPGSPSHDQSICRSDLDMPVEEQEIRSSSSPDVKQADSKKRRTLLVTIPRFCETFNCVLINLKNLESHLLSFK